MPEQNYVKDRPDVCDLCELVPLRLPLYTQNIFDEMLFVRAYDKKINRGMKIE